MKVELLSQIVVIVVVFLVIFSMSFDTSKSEDNKKTEVILSRIDIIKELRALGADYNVSDSNEQLMEAYNKISNVKCVKVLDVDDSTLVKENDYLKRIGANNG